MLSVASILGTILQVFLFALLGRLIFDYIQMFSRTWRPRGIVVYLVEAIYTITDKPMKFVGRFIPPLRLGAVSLDMSFIVLFFGTQLLMGFVRNI
ncbi:MAG: YggT family protein [Actinobacteria bacterium]|nr:YggT family protein [Actinomycetota bacterium]